MITRRTLLVSALGLSALAWSGRMAEPRSALALDAPVDPELWRYLSLSPASIAAPTQAMPLLAGNAQLQADAIGLTIPFDMNDPAALSSWIQGMYNVALPNVFMTRALQDDFADLTGFEISSVTSGAEIGEPPNMVTFLRGTFDPARIAATQLGLGYQAVDVDGREVRSLSEDGEISLENPVQTMALARLNNSALLDDGTLVYTPTLDLMRQVLTPTTTLAEAPEVERAMETLDSPLITSMLLGPGSFLPGIPVELSRPATQDEIAAFMQAMRAQAVAPVVLAAIAGNTAGGPVLLDTALDPSGQAAEPRSLSKFALIYATPGDAVTAAQQIQQRLATGVSAVTGQPWTELFAATESVPLPELSSVLLTLEWLDRPAATTQLVFNRDLGFITG